MKKIIVCAIIGILFCSLQIPILADDADEEEINQLMEETILDVSTNVDYLPNINSRACIILDRGSKKILFEKDAYSKRPMASTTKIMTAILVLENANLQDIVTISKKAGGTGGSRLGLKRK